MIVEQHYILEVPKSVIEFISHLTHIHLQVHPESEIATKTLDTFISQTNITYREPLNHGVTSSPPLLDPKWKPVPKIYYKPYYEKK